MTNQEIFEFYKEQFDLEKNKKALSETTKYKYFNHIKSFIEALSINVIVAKRKEILEALDSLNLTPSMYNSMLYAVSNFYTVLMNTYEYANIIEYNPCYSIKKMKHKAKKKTPLSKEEAKLLLDSCDSVRNYAILQALFTTGCRISEITGLTLTQYNNRDENNRILLVNTKGSKERYIYLNEDCRNAIEKYLLIRKDSKYDNLFISNHRTPMKGDNINNYWKSLCEKCGVDNTVRNHLLRTTFATIKLDNGVPLEVLAEIMGHESVQTTLIYAKINKDKVKNCMLESML